ncbi:MAG: NmrA family NAD(P)-binding protein, partial [bacterium]|nr:NmrA family NAD(P)-binding protein [bacterium]
MREARIAVTGAAGKTGQAVLRALKRRGATTRALVRRGTQEQIVRDAGAQEVVQGDLLDARAIARLADDVGAIYHICPNVSPDEVEIG